MGGRVVCERGNTERRPRARPPAPAAGRPGLLWTQGHCRTTCLSGQCPCESWVWSSGCCLAVLSAAGRAVLLPPPQACLPASLHSRQESGDIAGLHAGWAVPPHLSRASSSRKPSLPSQALLWVSRAAGGMSHFSRHHCSITVPLYCREMTPREPGQHPAPWALPCFPRNSSHARMKVPQDSCDVATLASVPSDGNSPPFPGHAYSGLRVTSTSSGPPGSQTGPGLSVTCLLSSPSFSLKRSTRQQVWPGHRVPRASHGPPVAAPGEAGPGHCLPRPQGPVTGDQAAPAHL